MNARIRVILTVVSLIFAGLLAIQFVAVLLPLADRPNASSDGSGSSTSPWIGGRPIRRRRPTRRARRPAGL